MHPAVYTAFFNELEKIAIPSPVTMARPILKAYHPGAHGLETLAKGMPGAATRVSRGVAPVAAKAATTGAKSMASLTPSWMHPPK